MTVIQLWNFALSKIGVTQGIAALDEASREAYMGLLVYDHTLQLLLRLFPWAFATKYASNTEDVRHPLLLVAGPLWDDDPTVQTNVQAYDAAATYERGDVVRSASVNYICIATATAQAPPNATYWATEWPEDLDEQANGDWRYAYRYPDDCLFVRRLVPPGGDGRQYSEDVDRIRYRIGHDANGLLIYTNEQEANIEYTAIDCTSLFTDAVFLEAFAWMLAYQAAPALAKNGLTQDDCLKKALFWAAAASTLSSRESQVPKSGDPDWVTNR
jgi:hypothetical protein